MKIIEKILRKFGYIRISNKPIPNGQLTKKCEDNVYIDNVEIVLKYRRKRDAMVALYGEDMLWAIQEFRKVKKDIGYVIDDDAYEGGEVTPYVVRDLIFEKYYEILEDNGLIFFIDE